MTVQSFEQHFKTIWGNIATFFFLEMIWMHFLRPSTNYVHVKGNENLLH